MTTTIQIEGRLTWRVLYTEVDTMVGVCDPLGITLEADDADELRNMIGSTIHALFAALFLDRELDGFLRARGWVTSNPLPEQVSPENVPEFHMPYSLESASA